jgi:hypothetical protein
MKQVKGINKHLIMAERLFPQLFSGQRIEVEVQATKSLYFFKDHVKEVIERFKVHQLVSIGVVRSEKLQQIPHTVSETGNVTNEGKLKAGIHAFNLESLSKLSQSKNADCKFAVLGSFVETFTSKCKLNLLNLVSGFPDAEVSTFLLHVPICLLYNNSFLSPTYMC